MGSYTEGKREVCAWIRERFPKTSTVLDVGACDGVWRRLLPEYTEMDAVEVFKPYADALGGYRRVINEDIRGLCYEPYDLIIFGDVIEHMSAEDALNVLESAKPRCRDMVVAVPFLYEQGIVDDNPFQAHVQDDLTHELFMQRFPGFEALWKSDVYCYYHKEGKE